MRIAELFWNENNVEHLWAAHRVTPDEIEEIVFGVDGEPATYRLVRDGDHYKLFGETGSGRLLIAVGEYLGDRRFRVFAARDMNDAEKRAYRTR
jgi:uncharacterized DUF497 family protein